LLQKSIQRSLIPKDFWETLNSQSKEPSEWETLFANARLAQRVGISNVPKDEVKDKPDLTTYYTHGSYRMKRLLEKAWLIWMVLVFKVLVQRRVSFWSLCV
jgi:hypothetical protein